MSHAYKYTQIYTIIIKYPYSGKWRHSVVLMNNKVLFFRCFKTKQFWLLFDICYQLNFSSVHG